MKSFLLIALILLAGPVSAASWETTSFRTAQGGLVRVGMTAAEAQRELGPDAHRGRGKSAKKGNEVWIYQGTDGRYQVTVSGGQVRRIVVTPIRD